MLSTPGESRGAPPWGLPRRPPADADPPLAREQERLAAVLRAATEISIIGTDRDGLITVFNSGAERMLGYSAGELLGRLTPLAFHDPAEVAARAAELGIEPGFEVFIATAHRGEAETRDWTYLRKDGSRLPVSLTVTAMYDRAGRLDGFIGIASDLTERRRAEREREEWASIIAHDLRQPLTAITGHVTLLQTIGQRYAWPHEQVERSLAHIHSAARTLDRMIADLTDVSGLETHRLKLAREPVDLSVLVQLVVERSAELTRGRPVRIGVEPGLPRVEADPGRIEQVLGNLLSNAGKYGDPDTEILVRVERRGDAVEVAVTNRGPGIPPEDLPRLFSRFHRSPGAEREPGLGLGLYICKGLVEAHGGRIWVESTPGQTTTFRFTLPVTGR